MQNLRKALIDFCIVLILAAIGFMSAVLVIGCAKDKVGWMPATKHEMRMLIGQTTMEAIHAYRKGMSEQHSPHSLDPDSQTDPKSLDNPERKY